MKEQLEEISQISIYLKEEQERVNEVALFQPLALKTAFDVTSKPINQRKWSYTQNLPLLRRLSLKVQSFLFKKAPFFVPKERLTEEAKFKTVLALLLAQESLRDFFFATEKRRDNFFAAIRQAARARNYHDFSVPEGNTPLTISQNLTTLTGKSKSLIDDLSELNLQMAALNHNERNEILFNILNHVERPPIHSIVEVMHGEKIKEIALTTKYAQYKVKDIYTNGKVDYRYIEDYATSSIRTRTNMQPGVKGVVNQRYSLDAMTGEWIGSYSGELTSKRNLLEQILFMLDVKGEKVTLVDDAPNAEEKTFLFTSLFSWHEIGLITDQHKAIRELNRKVLKIGERSIRLHLIHYNISFNAFNKYPTPREIGATITDINDEALILLTHAVWEKLGLHSEELTKIKQTVDANNSERDFLKHQEKLLKTIDAFRSLKKELIIQLEDKGAPALLTILKGKMPDGRKLQGIDLLLHLNEVTKELGYSHNKNCQNATDRSGGGSAADKAQHAFQKIYFRSFLPGYASKQEVSLFSVLYSMYLVWEEPEINAALSTGFVGEKFYQNFFQKNPETTRYLIRWLKKHPEIYLGLSDQRS